MGNWGWSDQYGWKNRIKYNYKCCSINAPNPTPAPVARPTPIPISTPTSAPVANPTKVPVAPPTPLPSFIPTLEPTTLAPVADPTDPPTEIPISHPTLAPVATPTDAPTEAPVVVESGEPTEAPVATPTDAPVATPTMIPIALPTEIPIASPTLAPVAVPSAVPSLEPVAVPTLQPTVYPTEAPVAETTERPTINTSPLICKVQFNQKADAYTKELSEGCGIIAVNDIGYPDFTGTSDGLIVCGSTKIGDLTATNIGITGGISYLYSAPKMQMDVYEKKNFVGNPTMGWRTQENSFIHSVGNDKVGSLDFKSSVGPEIATPTSCTVGTKLELPAPSPTPAPKVEDAGGNVTKEEPFDDHALPSEDEVTHEGGHSVESDDESMVSASLTEGTPEGEELPTAEEIKKEEEEASHIPAPTVKPEVIVENTDDKADVAAESAEDTKPEEAVPAAETAPATETTKPEEAAPATEAEIAKPEEAAPAAEAAPTTEAAKPEEVVPAAETVPVEGEAAPAEPVAAGR